VRLRHALLAITAVSAGCAHVIPPKAVCANDVLGNASGSYELEVSWCKEGVGPNVYTLVSKFDCEVTLRAWIYVRTVTGRVEAPDFSLSYSRWGSRAGFHREPMRGYIAFQGDKVNLQLEPNAAWPAEVNGTYALLWDKDCRAKSTPTKD
jgi:hypothetical protein